MSSRLLVLLAALVCACNSGDSGQDAGHSRDATILDAGQRDAEFQCVSSGPDAGMGLTLLADLCVHVGRGNDRVTLNSLYGCGEPMTLSDFEHLGLGQAGCAVFAPTLKGYEQAITAGRLSYDKDKAAACMAAGQADGGSPYADGGLIDPCNRVFVGQVAIGGACQANIECLSGAYCRWDGHDSCDGTCVALIASDQPCDPDHDLCRQELRCRPPAATGSWTCRAPAQDGDQAQSGAECADGLAFADGFCRRPRQSGEDCSSAPCAGSLACVQLTGSQVCKKSATLGEACSSSAAGAPPCGGCLNCDSASHRCLASGSVGSSCGSGLPACLTGLYCSEAGTCQVQARAGERCAINGDNSGQGSCMWSDDYCWRSDPSSTSGICVSKPRLCEPCGQRSDLALSCAEGTCDQGHSTCVPVVRVPRAIGEPCDDFNSCASGGWCPSSADGGLRTCVAARAMGEACTDGTQCASGYCTQHGLVCAPACDEGNYASGCGGWKDLIGYYLFFGAACLQRVRRRRPQP